MISNGRSSFYGSQYQSVAHNGYEHHGSIQTTVYDDNRINTIVEFQVWMICCSVLSAFSVILHIIILYLLAKKSDAIFFFTSKAGDHHMQVYCLQSLVFDFIFPNVMNKFLFYVTLCILIERHLVTSLEIYWKSVRLNANMAAVYFVLPEESCVNKKKTTLT